MIGDEMLMPFTFFFLGDLSTDRIEDVRDCFSGLSWERSRFAGLLLPFFKILLFGEAALNG
jgi:hypothetical protein